MSFSASVFSSNAALAISAETYQVTPSRGSDLEAIGPVLLAVRINGGTPAVKGRQDLLDLSDGVVKLPCSRIYKSAFDHMVNYRKKWIPISVVVKHDDGLIMHTKLRHGYNVKDLIKRSQTARQSHKSVRKIAHNAFAGLHILDYVERVRFGLGNLNLV